MNCLEFVSRKPMNVTEYCHYFADDTSLCIFLIDSACVLIKISHIHDLTFTIYLNRRSI